MVINSSMEKCFLQSLPFMEFDLNIKVMETQSSSKSSCKNLINIYLIEISEPVVIINFTFSSWFSRISLRKAS